MEGVSTTAALQGAARGHNASRLAEGADPLGLWGPTGRWADEPRALLGLELPGAGVGMPPGALGTMRGLHGRPQGAGAIETASGGVGTSLCPRTSGSNDFADLGPTTTMSAAQEHSRHGDCRRGVCSSAVCGTRPCGHGGCGRGVFSSNASGARACLSGGGGGATIPKAPPPSPRVG